MDKSIVDPQSSYPVGDTVTSEVEGRPQLRLLRGSKVEDTLPAGLEYVTGSVQVTVPATITVEHTPLTDSNTDFFEIVGSLYRFAFGEVNASESSNLTLHYDVLVANILSNQSGTTLDNSAELHKLDPDTGACLLLDSDSTTVTVGEPYIVLDKHILSSTAGLTNGEEVDFQIDVSNTGNQTAFGLEIADVVVPSVFGSITDYSVTASSRPCRASTPLTWTSRCSVRLTLTPASG